MRIDEKAQKYLDKFSTSTRDDGSLCVHLKAGHGKKLHDAVYQAHGDKLRNDFIYSTFEGLLNKITEYEIEDMDKLEDLRSEIVESQCDIYTHDQLKWLASDVRNLDYLEEAITSRSYSKDDGMWQLLQYTQYLAIDEVMSEVINLLNK